MTGLAALGFAFAVLLLALPPLGEFPQQDDWDYAATAREWAATGRLRLSDFPAMPLVTHAAWGAAWVSLFGPSWLALRLSVRTLALFGSFALYLWCRHCGRPRTESLFAALCFGFTPVFVYLSYTFMTDVTGLALMLAFLGLLPASLRNRSTGAFGLLSVVGSMGYLVRQTAALPWIVTSVLLLIDWARSRLPLRHLLAALLPGAALVGAYCGWLHFEHGAPYNTKLDRLAPEHLLSWKMLAAKLLVSLLVLGLYLSPITFCAVRRNEFRALWRSRAARWTLLAGAAGWALILALAPDEIRAYEGHEVEDLRLGYAEFGSTAFAGPSIRVGPWSVSAFWLATTLIGMVSITILLAMLARVLAGGAPRRSRWPSSADATFPAAVAALSLLAALGLLLLLVSRNDRYYLVPLALSIATLATLPREKVPMRPSWAAALVFAALTAFAVAGTQDCLARTAALWRTVARLHARGVPPDEIDAGFEYRGTYLDSPRYRGPIRRGGPYLARLSAADREAELAARRPENPRYVVRFAAPPDRAIEWAQPYKTWLRSGRVFVIRRRAQ